MGYQVYKVGKRWGGYGVPCICEYPTCKKRIDRGISYACGGEPFSEYGCDRYFCSKHLIYTGFKQDGSDERCAKNKSPFPYKPEVKSWVRHLLKHKSWEEWRNKNPEEVKRLMNNK